MRCCHLADGLEAPFLDLSGTRTQQASHLPWVGSEDEIACTSVEKRALAGEGVDPIGVQHQRQPGLGHQGPQHLHGFGLRAEPGTRHEDSLVLHQLTQGPEGAPAEPASRGFGQGLHHHFGPVRGQSRVGALGNGRGHETRACPQRRQAGQRAGARSCPRSHERQDVAIVSLVAFARPQRKKGTDACRFQEIQAGRGLEQ